jgi:hypothetical protein
VGIATQTVAGLLALVIARIVPFARPRRWWIELIVCLFGSLAAGMIATALDFGGWATFDWRAAFLGFVTAILMSGVTRITLLLSKPSNTPPGARS